MVEFDLMQSAVKQFNFNILERRTSYPNSCWNTGLAPTCAVIQAEGQHWLLMRKINIPVSVPGVFDSQVKVQLDDQIHSIKQFDLKGPKWSMWDGKANMGATELLQDKQMVK